MDDLLMYAAKLSFGLIGVMIVLRLMGKKEIAQVTPLDFVYALLLGGIIEESLYDETVPVYEMLFSIFFWALIIFILEKFALKNRTFKSIGQGNPIILINNGKLNSEIMKKNNMNVEEVRMLLRMKDIFSLSKVKYAILEESGQLSVMQYASEEPPNRKEFEINHPKNVLSHLIINEGKIEKQKLEEINKDETWLRDILKVEGVIELKDVYFAEWNENDGVLIQKYVK